MWNYLSDAHGAIRHVRNLYDARTIENDHFAVFVTRNKQAVLQWLDILSVEAASIEAGEGFSAVPRARIVITTCTSNKTSANTLR